MITIHEFGNGNPYILLRHLPRAELMENEGVGHAEFFTLYPERFVKKILECLCDL